MESIDEKYTKVKSFCNVRGGDFDGMIDLHYRNNVKSEDGIYFSFSTSYIFTSNKPPYGSKEYDLREQLNLTI